MSDKTEKKADWKKLGLEIIRQGLPILGGAIGNAPGAALAAVIAKAIPGGADPDRPDAILEALKSDPQAIVELQKLQMQHMEQLEHIKAAREKQELDSELAYLSDVQNARSREVEITKATGSKDNNLYVLAWTVVGGFILLTAMTLFIDIPEKNNQAVFLLLGGFVGGFTSVLGYFFGSSKGSDEKNVMMQQMQALMEQMHAKPVTPLLAIGSSIDSSRAGKDDV